MNYEFEIGTAIGIAGLVLSYICGKDQIKSYFRPSMKDLLNQLVSSDVTLSKQQSILKKIRRKMMVAGMGKISSEYIATFNPVNRTKTRILLDICVANNLEPTTQICKAFLDYDSPELRKEWNRAMQEKNPIHTESNVGKTELKEVDMNPVMRPNTVYVSSLLKEKYPKASGELFSILKKHHIPVKELSNTKDIWCRDYMPIQNRLGELIQFNYDPSYLKGKKEWEETRSDVHEVCHANDIKPIFSEIKIDGGNVVLYGDKAILTNRIFSENPEYERNQLIAEIENLLKAKVIIIPAINTDVTGHADGMVRFVDEKTILGNDLEAEYKYVREGINKACETYGLKYIHVPFFEPPHDKKHEMSAIGIYVNYLEVGNLIVLPKFGIEGNRDQETEVLFRSVFPGRIIETIDYNEVAEEGGLLNCSTWTIKE